MTEKKAKTDDKKYLWQVLVPCNYNNGKPIRTRHHREWDRQVQRITGGLTILPPGKGKWKDLVSGREFIDRVIPVQIMATRAELDLVVELTIKHYRQLAVMSFRVSEAAMIKYATPAQRDKFMGQDAT